METSRNSDCSQAGVGVTGEDTKFIFLHSRSTSLSSGTRVEVDRVACSIEVRAYSINSLVEFGNKAVNLCLTNASLPLRLVQLLFFYSGCMPYRVELFPAYNILMRTCPRICTYTCTLRWTPACDPGNSSTRTRVYAPSY